MCSTDRGRGVLCVLCGGGRFWRAGGGGDAPQGSRRPRGGCHRGLGHSLSLMASQLSFHFLEEPAQIARKFSGCSGLARRYQKDEVLFARIILSAEPRTASGSIASAPDQGVREAFGHRDTMNDSTALECMDADVNVTPPQGYRAQIRGTTASLEICNLSKSHASF